MTLALHCRSGVPDAGRVRPRVSFTRPLRASTPPTLNTPPTPLGPTRPSAASHRPHPALRPSALASDDAGRDNDGGEAEADDIAAARARLLAGSASSSSTCITGPQLRAAVREKYGRDYAVLLARRGRRVFFQILWKHLEQASYPQTEEEHAATFDAVASFLSEWGAGGTVLAAIAAGPRRGPGYTGGGAARAISIPLDVDLSTARSGEFF